LAQLAGLEAPLVGFVDQLPQPALLALVAARQPQLQALAPGRVRVVADMDPLRATDELRHLAAGPGQRLGYLHAAGAAADDAPALSGIGHAVVPARRVERRAGEAVTAGDGGKQRLMEKAGRADENVSDIGGAVGGLDMPATVGKPRRD